MNALHIYQQSIFHDPAFIVGTKESLQSLRNAIDKALLCEFDTVSAFTTDGEGYDIHVELITESTNDWFENIQLPYTDGKSFGINNEGKHHPCDSEKVKKYYADLLKLYSEGKLK